ncbi:histidine phosphatase superfamily [Elsinoe ampelina]|uniref:Histidine phosphatase superfamily n=1 Tax=Elsinoe ampelina TaxID=302913 RepID=A0A6A6GPF8_9PEZI|nr:histidine phosphatase superfamily [Elsinoe ampelina]
MVAFTLSLLGVLILHSSTTVARPQDDVTPAPTEFSYTERIGSPSKTTFSISTAATANPVASGISVDGGKAYIKYSTVEGYFLQDLNTTDPATFDYTAQNFGLLNRTYPSDTWFTTRFQTQWQRFSTHLSQLNTRSPPHITYKLLFLARHGEGTHNSAETFYTTPSWNCYYAQADGNSTTTWADATLTPSGESQSTRARNYWTRLLKEQRITPPGSFYVSPLTRCLQTADETWRDVPLPGRRLYRPVVKEFLREGMSIHTCDRRSSRSVIRANFPGMRFEETFAENDTLWSGVVAETPSAQDYRSKLLLDDVWGRDRGQVLSFTSHSGETRSLLRVLGHVPFSLSTGSVLPVLVRGEKVRGRLGEVTTEPWKESAWCTNGAPVTSVAGGACVCSNGVAPTAVSPGVVFTTRPVR